MKGKSLTDEHTEQAEAHSIAQDATDDETLAAARLTVYRMRHGEASIQETRGVVGTMAFLLRYIDRLDGKWHARFEDEVGLRIRKRDEAKRVRKLQTQRRRREKSMGAEGGAATDGSESVRCAVSQDSGESEEAGAGGESKGGGPGAVPRGRDVSSAETARERAAIRGGM